MSATNLISCVTTEASPAMARARVVLVDDEPSILDTWGIILAAQGYEVRCFPDPIAAMEAIADGCEVVITDYHMPRMSGVELIHMARPWSKAKFLLMTANASEEVTKAAFAAGVCCVVHKPTSAPLVLQKIASLCQSGF